MVNIYIDDVSTYTMMFFRFMLTFCDWSMVWTTVLGSK